MPQLAGAARTKTVETRTVEEVPSNETESQSLGMPWDEYLRTLSDDDREITTVKFYRVEPKGLDEGFIVKLCPAPAIDEDYLGRTYGSGVYAAKIWGKNGKSHYERRILVGQGWGPPKGTPGAAAAVAGGVQTSATAPAADSALNRLADILERQNERFERMFDRGSAPAAVPAAQESVVNVMAEASKAAIGVVAEAARQSFGPAHAAPAAPAESFDRDLQRLKLLKEIIGPPAAAPPASNLIDQIGQLGTVVEALDKLRGGAGGGSGDWKTAVAEKLADHIPDVVDLGKAIFTGRVKEAEASQKREEARRDSVKTLASLQHRGGMPGPSGAPPPGPTVTAAPPQPAHAAPLTVVPLSSAAPFAGAPATAAEPLPAVEVVSSPEDNAAMIDRFLKERVVQLVREGDDAAAVVDFIDRAAPQIGAILTQASERQIRKFLADDAVLAEITRLPHYEAFLRDLLAALNDSDEPPAGSPPPLKIN